LLSAASAWLWIGGGGMSANGQRRDG